MSSYKARAPYALQTDTNKRDNRQYEAGASMTPTRDSASGLNQMMAYARLQHPSDTTKLSPPPPPALYEDDYNNNHSNNNNGSAIGTAKSGDEALLDLAELEELQEEAERMKALGNKHMAAQVRVCVCVCVLVSPNRAR
jgi:hypothetical protein